MERVGVLVGDGEKDAEHVQLDGYDHQVGGPAMHVAQQFAEGNVVFEVQHIAEGLHFARVVVKHQQHAGKSKHDEQIKCDATHAPGVASHFICSSCLLLPACC